MKIIITLLALATLGSFSLQAADGDKPKKPAPSPEEMFKKKDGNADGKISKEEWTKGAKDAANAKLDKDASGDVSLEELKAGGAKKKKKA